MRQEHVVLGGDGTFADRCSRLVGILIEVVTSVAVDANVFVPKGTNGRNNSSYKTTKVTKLFFTNIYT